MHLFHIPGTRSTRVLWTLEEIGAPYEITVIDHRQKHSDEHAARHPLRRVPVLELDHGRFVFESAAICLYLGDALPAGRMLPPAGSPERGLAYQWSVFAVTELEPAVFEWMRARRAGDDDAEHAERLAPLQACLDGALRDRPWLLGDDFSVADVLVASMLGTAIRRELGDPTPTLRDYTHRAQERPAYLRAAAIGRPTT
jgi:glutathione S-transferase